MPPLRGEGERGVRPAGGGLGSPWCRGKRTALAAPWGLSAGTRKGWEPHPCPKQLQFVPGAQLPGSPGSTWGMESALGRLPRVAVLHLSGGGVTLRLGSNFLWVGTSRTPEIRAKALGWEGGNLSSRPPPRQHLGILTNLTSFVLFLYV